MTESKSGSGPRGRPRIVAFIAAGAVLGMLAAVAGALLLTNIMERRREARNPFYPVVELTDTTTDASVWGRNFPLQYDAYRRTVDQVRTKYGGSEALPREPSDADPRSWVAQSRLAEDPRLVTMWSGYAFAQDFREERGHAYMLDDQLYTERQQAARQPGTCVHCHASVYAPYLRLGEGDLMAGFARMNAMPYDEARTFVDHPVSCVDCHDPASMALRVTRPGFIEGIAALRRAEGVTDYDVNRDATRQEMRTFVCGQCHVEYYFRGPEKRLTYPWTKGLHADSILSYYEDNGHADWTHAVTGAPVLKAQHPEFELYSQGIHARSGVACADCHMPYERVGALKISDHHVRSPLLNVNNACQTCHKWEEQELLQRVERIQDRTFELRNIAIDGLVAFIGEMAEVQRRDSADANLVRARGWQRKAQFLIDFIEAENSMGFHAPQEAARLLGRAIDYVRRGQVALRGGDPGVVNVGVPPRTDAPPVPQRNR